MKRLASSIALAAVVFTAPVFADMSKGTAPLRAVAGSKAEGHVTAGIEHYGMGHWDIAKTHFMEAEKADPQSAEAHYDLALALDKTGDHAGAIEHFKRAKVLGKGNTEIESSEILVKHLKM